MKDTHQLRRRAGRIGERSQNVEQSAHAKLPPHRSGVFHRRVVRRRKHEADPYLVDAAAHLLGLQVDVCAQRLQHVRTARLRRHGPVAVLGAAAVISPMVSFFTRNPTTMAAIMTGETCPLMICRIRSSISSWNISRCSMVRVSASWTVMLMPPPVAGNFSRARAHAR